MHNRDLGNWGEEQASEYLRKEGYEIIGEAEITESKRKIKNLKLSYIQTQKILLLERLLVMVGILM